MTLSSLTAHLDRDVPAGHLAAILGEAGRRVRLAQGGPVSKTCSRCRTAKPVDAFARDRTRKDGRQPSCRVCHAAQRSA